MIMGFSGSTAGFVMNSSSQDNLAIPFIGHSKQGSEFALFSTTESEAEALLRKARELKAAAAAAEESLHNSLLEKKAKRDADTDSIIDKLFPIGEDAVESVVERLKAKRLSTDCLVRLVERLHEREVTARGIAHVEPSIHHDHTDFKVITSKVDSTELDRVSGLVDRLISASKILDEEWIRDKEAKGEKYRTHTEAEHWTAGDLAKILDDKVKDLRREHDDQFRRRQEEYYEAALKKEEDEREVRP